MTGAKIMAYQLPPEIDHRVQAYLGTGGFQNEDEVLHTALDALEEREQEKLRRWNEGNRIAIEQSEQGLSKPLDDEAVIARLRARLAKEGIIE
jgi:Arc/MetJ-type ribon-helix-helix transcriptional regulator